ncbi:YhbY family RNA-binding protein [Castellaniella sp.]|uniref:YhbY family RNA-binding protein n=1 Tax=Castellaniella sp. TaxID=1955812 RepID=UPI003C71B9FA
MPKLELSSQQRRDLRAAAHPLHPIVLIGDKGLTDAVLAEIDHSLTAHELIKVRIAGAERPERETMLDTICETLSCAAVHHLGKTLIIYRPDLLAQQAALDAQNRTRAVRKKSAPYVPKKQAASPNAGKPAHAGQKAATAPESASPKARRAAISQEPARKGRKPAGGRQGLAAAPHGIPRRSSGSALSLRAGARRSRNPR